MTLKEYLKQKDPKRGIVYVKDNEFKVASTMNLFNETRKRVYFKTKNKILSGIEYCLIGNTFYTVDSDGNPKNQSCFRLSLNLKPINK